MTYILDYCLLIILIEKKKVGEIYNNSPTQNDKTQNKKYYLYHLGITILKSS